MRRKKFNKLLLELDKLTYSQKCELLTTIQKVESTNKLLCSISVFENCKHCDSKDYVKWGKRAGIQRYKCKMCSKTFNQLSNTPLARLRNKNEWLKNTQEMIKGTSLEATAKVCNIAISTAFRWRHKFLELLSHLDPTELKGIVEVDETYFRESHKGERGLKSPKKRGEKAKKPGLSSEQIPVLVARDRNGATLSRQLGAVNIYNISATLVPIIQKDSVICTDGHAVYATVAKNCKALHKPLNIKSGIKVREKIYHIQNVNAYDSRMKLWIKRFHGVATKYLQRYVGWWRVLDTFKNITDTVFLQTAIGIKNNFQPVMLI